ncbi:MAG: hypothetical protein BHW01_04615 [Clostridium sp. 27_14]|mgnify:FL=1|nr:MAG: hypothetical protein BHW01_04615 [Clostridium sp. 27_14]
MQKFGEFIVNHRRLIIIICLLLLIPSIIGIKATKINYDILSYLPDTVDTVKGQNILTDEFGVGSYSIVIIDNKMKDKDILKMEDKIKEIDAVDKVISKSDILGTSIPEEMLPDDVKEAINKDGTIPILVTFKTGMAAGETLDAIDDLRDIVGDSCKVSGISATSDDIRILLDQEMSVYVVVASIFCIIVLMIALDSYGVPLIILGGIGIAILYNMGTNIVLGQISYITKAIATVLQLGVTMDFSIFLYHSYQRQKEILGDKNKAMATAIKETLVSIVGSSTTTIAGFLALCTMSLTLGTDIGLVMAKGVLIGVITTVTLLPSLLLAFDKVIEKTKHKELLPEFKKFTNFIVNHYKAMIVVFLLLLAPAIYGNNNVKVYYNLNKSLPDTLQSVSANKELQEKFNMVSTQMVLVNKDMKADIAKQMINEIKDLDGVDGVIGLQELLGDNISKEMIPDDILSIFENDKYQLLIINSTYENATDESNALIQKVNEIVSKYDENAIMAGEGPLMNDLVKIADHDFNSVNVTSAVVIFVIMIFVFKSISLPVILIAVIEFAIFANMSFTSYFGTVIPFIASIVIGTIQLGATVDYAILMTNKYVKNRKDGLVPKEAMRLSLQDSIKSVIVSAFCFFAATCGVSLFSNIEMIGSICTLISRGAIISMVVVLTILPACLILCDRVICKTTKGLVRK